LDDSELLRRSYRVGVKYESLLVVLDTRGSPPGDDALESLQDARPVWVRVECEGRSVCLAARVRHGDPGDAFQTRVRAWAATRGWVVTVAPCAPSV